MVSRQRTKENIKSKQLPPGPFLCSVSMTIIIFRCPTTVDNLLLASQASMLDTEWRIRNLKSQGNVFQTLSVIYAGYFIFMDASKIFCSTLHEDVLVVGSNGTYRIQGPITGEAKAKQARTAALNAKLTITARFRSRKTTQNNPTRLEFRWTSNTLALWQNEIVMVGIDLRKAMAAFVTEGPTNTNEKRIVDSIRTS